MNHRILFLLGGLLLPAGSIVAQEATPAEARSAVRRHGEPDYVRIEERDKAMDRAVQKARKSIGSFIEALRSPGAAQRHFAVKKPFVQGDKIEHIWLDQVTYDGSVFHGTVNNEPEDIKGVRLGQKVTVKPEDISDWMYVEKGRLVGGYTIRALCRDLSASEKRQFEKEVKFRVD